MTPLLFLVFAIIAVSFLGKYSYEQCFNYYIKDQYGMTSAYNGIFKAVIALLSLLLNSTICTWMQQKTDINQTFLYVLFALTGLTLCALIFKDKWVFIGVYILFNSVDVLRKPLLQSRQYRDPARKKAFWNTAVQMMLPPSVMVHCPAASGSRTAAAVR